MKCEMYADKGESIGLQYYEIKNDRPPLVLLHAQAVDSTSFFGVMPALARRFHVYAVDCYGHGGSLQDAAKYNVADCGEAIVRFLQDVVKAPACLLGHSSGGLIAAYAASHSDLCRGLVLEDPPFFASQGERRKQTFNYVDLSSICHAFLQQTEKTDFVLYYFVNQRIWEFFPEASREKLRPKLIAAAAKDRQRHPDRDLHVPFWPKAALAAYQGMQRYDPRFGETFYTGSFHAGIDHADLLRGISLQDAIPESQSRARAGRALAGGLGRRIWPGSGAGPRIVPLPGLTAGTQSILRRKKEFLAALSAMAT